MNRIIRSVLRKAVSASVISLLAAGFLAPLAQDVEASELTVAIESLYSDENMIHLKSVAGNNIDIFIDGTSIGINTSCATDITFKIVQSNNNMKVRHTANESFVIDVAADLTQDMLYRIDVEYTADGFEQNIEDIFITVREDGNLTFVNSPIYDFNLERCSELWTDEQSLQECLQPQNDVESDNPYVIEYAREITSGLQTDWDKAFAIYKYIIENFSYDFVQLDDSSIAYQDDALLLIRRKIAICEGLGNTFVALCRAAGVPAAVSFGIGADTEEILYQSSYLTDEDPNHAWAMVCLDGTWYCIDPTWDGIDSYEGSGYYQGSISEQADTYDWFALPLEVFSFTHKICDADTIHSIPSTGSCGDNATYEITRDGTITISGSGEVNLPYGLNGFRYVLFAPDSNITSIGEDCFIDCDIIERVILPDTVTRIEDRAFYTCEDLEYVYIPEGVTYIGQQAFDFCDELAYAEVPDSVTEIGRWAFDDCSRLIISVPAGLDLQIAGYDVQPERVIEREG